jgi:hypothetical protein
MTQFTNKTDYSIYISSWVNHTYGINKYTEVEVGPGKEVTIYSTTGEWELNDYFYDDNVSRFHNCGYKRCEYIGKFRLEPCVQGKRAWLENDHYDIVYDRGFTFTNK